LKCGRNGWLAEMQLAVVVAANVIAAAAAKMGV
jgi:hypothetical protein